MKKHITKLQKFLYGTEHGHHALNKYQQMMEQDGWKIHRDSLLMLKGYIIEELLGRQFTKLPPIDKDVQQRAYAGINEVIDFLLNPLAEARSVNAIKLHNQKMGATVTGATKGDGK